MTDKFPADLVQDIRTLQLDLGDSQASQKRGPLLEASAGWIMRNMATPASPPTNDVHIYAKSGRLYAKSTLGDVPLLDQPVAAKVDPLAAASGTTGSTIVDVGASFNQANINNNDRRNADKINEVIAALKAIGLMSSI